MENIKKIKVKFDGEFLLELMKEKGISRKQLAKDVGIIYNDLCAYIHGRIMPNVNRLYQMSIYLDCLIEDLLKEVE